ncbi:MAG: hypothetical protein AB1742_00190 [bacterium]
MNADDAGETRGHEEGAIPFYPLHMTKEIMVMIGVIIVVFTLSTIHPAGIEEPADSFSTPEHIKPEWYFLALYQALKYVPQGKVFDGLTFLNLAVLLQGAAFAFLVALPFIDGYPHSMARKRPLFLAVGLAAILFMLVFTYLGYFSGMKDPILGINVH